MIVVCNASPLISLAKIDCLHLLPDLFQEVSIAPEVYHEVIGAGANRPGATAVESATWIRVQAIKDTVRLQEWRRTHRLGAGEVATLILAQELVADFAIVDERAARLLAVQHDIKVLGCIGILEIAYRQSRLTDLRAAYQELIAQRVHISVEILNRSLAGQKLPSL